MPEAHQRGQPAYRWYRTRQEGNHIWKDTCLKAHRRGQPAYRRRKIFFPCVTEPRPPKINVVDLVARSEIKLQNFALDESSTLKFGGRGVVLVWHGKNILRLPSRMWDFRCKHASVSRVATREFWLFGCNACVSSGAFRCDPPPPFGLVCLGVSRQKSYLEGHMPQSSPTRPAGAL